MGKTYTSTCRCCGEVFEARHSSIVYCDKEECQNSKVKPVHPIALPTSQTNKTLGVIAEIMKTEGITYTKYAQNRSYYIGRYEKRRYD